jgi:hypothetical protein
VGVPDTVAMRSMGHADTRILARYQDVVSELQRDAAARMDQLLGSTEEETVTRSVTLDSARLTSNHL